MPDYPNVDEDSFAPSGFADQEFNALGAYQERLADTLVRMERQRY